MTRKMFSVLLLVVALLLPNISLVTYASEKSDALDTVYAMYYELLDENDIKNIKIIDLNNDGVPELLYDNAKSVYTVKNGKLVNYSAPLVLSSYITPKSGQMHFTKDSAGINYIMLTFWTGSHAQHYVFYTLTENGLEIVQDMYKSFSPDFEITGPNVDIHSNTGTYFYYVDTKFFESHSNPKLGGVFRSVSSTEFNSVQQKYLCNGDEIITSDTFASKERILAQLEQYIPTYVNQYRTPASWAVDSVRSGITSGIIPESLQKKYSWPITRAEFCALATRFYENAVGQTITQTTQFNDTTDSNVQKMGGMGIVTGTGNGNFDPNGLLTREAAAAILARLADKLYITLDDAVPTFEDNNKISSWAFDQVGRIQASGIMGSTGNNQFSPQTSYTREQSIVTIMRMKDMVARATELVLSESEIVVPAKSAVRLNATIYPENVANKNLTWVSSDNLIPVNNGIVWAAYERSTPITITATTENGISANCEITILDEHHVDITADLPKTVNCIALQDTVIPRDSDIDFVPVDPVIVGTITIDEIETKISDDFQMLELNARITENESGYSKSTYLKWVVEDENGEVVDSGIKTFFFRKKINDVVSISIIVDNMIPGQAYTIRFISDEGKSVDDVNDQAPEFNVEGVPLTVSERNLHNDEMSTTTIMDADVETEYDSNRNCWYGSITFSGTADIPGFMGPKFKWTLEDENGAVVKSGSCNVYGSDVTSEGDFVLEPRASTKKIKLESGQVYVLHIYES